MEPFVLERPQPLSTSSEIHPTKDMEDDTSNQLTKEDLNVLLQGLEQLDFEQP